ncbi:hypothetical protein BOW51_12025 [Solemya velesiana gill symbiont]|uniref:Tyr recombinase domain-containing protein n=1 Tax=Solemya velesiana gill symbiont TaxID=1918948 RepID=A0A1T2KP13_9GAMM|nr:hypothetical protein BOW51_12025 [Solemya velesiana gill symbiont]
MFNATLFHDGYYVEEIGIDQVSNFFKKLSKELTAKHEEHDVRQIRISSHRLRHSMATILAPQGDIRALQDSLGHTDVRMTLEYVESNIEAQKTLLANLPQIRPSSGKNSL